MDMISPKDAFVTSILVSDGSHVNAGTTVLTLDATNEELRIARITALEKLRKLLSKRLSTDVVSLSRGLKQVDLDSATAVLSDLQQYLQAVSDAAQFGREPPNAPLLIEQMIYPISQQKNTADLQIQSFDLQVVEAGKINDRAAQHLQQELAAANALRDRLRIVSPLNGKVSLKVTNGRFARHGDLLFAIS
jgi:multidrug efflux pump subunit AcrA (membrane-fusion protein)